MASKLRHPKLEEVLGGYALENLKILPPTGSFVDLKNQKGANQTDTEEKGSSSENIKPTFFHCRHNSSFLQI